MQIFFFCDWCQVYFTNCQAGKGKDGALVHIPLANKSTHKILPTNELCNKKLSTTPLVQYCFLYSTFSNMIIAFQYCRLPTTTPTRKLKSVIAMELCHTNTTSGLNLEVGQEMTFMQLCQD